MSSAAMPTQKMDLPLNIKVAYVINTVAAALGMVIPMGYMTLYFQNYIELSPALVALLTFIAGVINLPFSLIAGSIVQKSNSKLGQYRSWFIICSLISYVGTVLCFLPGIQTPGKALFVAVGFIISRVPANFNMAAGNGLQMKICGPNMMNRLGLAALSMQASNAITIITSATTAPLAIFLNNFFAQNGVDIGRGYQILALVYGAFGLFGSFNLFRVSKSYDIYDPNRKTNTMTNVSFLEMYKAYVSNKTLVAFAIRDIIAMLGMIAFGLNIYYFVYGFNVPGDTTPHYENLNMQAIANTITTALGLLGAFVMPPIGRKIGMKRTTLIVNGILCFTALINGFFSFGRLWVYITCQAVATFIMAASTAFGFNMYLNPCEEQLYKTGKDVRVAVMTLAMVPMSIGQLIGAPLTPILYKLIGFDQSVWPPVITNPHLLVQIMFWLPIPTTLISLLITLFAYKMTDQQAQFYISENQKRLMEQMMKAAEAKPAT
jgi:GPH family glycoside/pentoside/hexuronide:cation symporter